MCENNLLPIVLSVFQSPEEDIHEISDSYSEALEALVKVLPKTILKDKLIPLAVNMGRVESAPISECI